MYAIYGSMDHIKINPSHVSINIPAPWIRHGYGFVSAWGKHALGSDPSHPKLSTSQPLWRHPPRPCPAVAPELPRQRAPVPVPPSSLGPMEGRCKIYLGESANKTGTKMEQVHHITNEINERWNIWEILSRCLSWCIMICWSVSCFLMFSLFSSVLPLSSRVVMQLEASGRNREKPFSHLCKVMCKQNVMKCHEQWSQQHPESQISQISEANSILNAAIVCGMSVHMGDQSTPTISHLNPSKLFKLTIKPMHIYIIYNIYIYTMILWCKALNIMVIISSNFGALLIFEPDIISSDFTHLEAASASSALMAAHTMQRNTGPRASGGKALAASRAPEEMESWWKWRLLSWRMGESWGGFELRNPWEKPWCGRDMWLTECSIM